MINNVADEREWRGAEGLIPDHRPRGLPPSQGQEGLPQEEAEAQGSEVSGILHASLYNIVAQLCCE